MVCHCNRLANDSSVLSSVLKNANIFKQEKVVHQTLGNTPPFILSPYSYTGRRGKGFAIELKCGLPIRLGSGGGRHVWPNLGYQLLDNDPSRCLGGSPCGHVAQAYMSLLS